MLGDQIRMLGDWPIRHLFDETVLAYERSAHVRDMVVRGRIVIGPAGALEPADGCAPSLDPEHRLTGHARSRSSSRVLTRSRQLGSAPICGLSEPSATSEASNARSGANSSTGPEANE